ncbi:polymeric immunoglobulin receptor-like [Epinephelus moara]|uniref:polymeric immunoglobulin receptor-like n=1 Tax=Epinephelus moara TaxID=300413 RepID=UPI00214F391C|nr:polymeric immunoglobulin receptor-like [Epinephelus moara]
MITGCETKREDSGEHWCKTVKGRRGTDVLKLVHDDNCKKPFNHTAYRSAKTTITCDFTGMKDKRFFCKEKNPSISEVVLSTRSPLWSNGTFTLTETNSGFNISITNVSSQHAGVYWCGVESNKRSYQAALRKIQLKVENIRNFTRPATIGQNFSYYCLYQKTVENKFICKGEDPSICEPLSMSDHNKNPGKFSMKDDKNKGNITITVINITKEDTGTYWCGAVSTDPRRSNPFFHRFVMTVVPPSPTSPVSSTQSTTVSAGSQVDLADSPQVIITVVVCVSVLLLLLFVLILILIYKRHFKNKRNAAQHIKEDYVYEEIQEHPQKPDSGHAMNSIYVTANFPTNPSASLHYSTVSFKNCSGEAGGEGLITRPCFSACEYSTVKDSQSPTNSTVNQPSSEDPLYATVCKPQKQ